MQSKLSSAVCLFFVASGLCSLLLYLEACHLIFPFTAPSVVVADADAQLDGEADAGAGEGPACSAKYGEVPGFILCSETATQCAFNADTMFSSCSAVCSDKGGTCLGVIDNPNDVGSECETAPEPLPVTCDSSTFETMLCVCDR